MDWAKLGLAVVSLIASLATRFREAQLMKAGADQVKEEIHKQEFELDVKAETSRAEARAANADVPRSDSLPDDGFRRD